MSRRSNLRLSSTERLPDGRIYGSALSPAVLAPSPPRGCRTQARALRESSGSRLAAELGLHLIEIPPGGRHARVRVREETGMLENGRSRLLHAIAEEEVGLRNGRIVALRLTERR